MCVCACGDVKSLNRISEGLSGSWYPIPCSEFKGHLKTIRQIKSKYYPVAHCDKALLHDHNYMSKHPKKKRDKMTYL